MGSICGGGGSSNQQTTTNTSSPPPQILADYNAGINRATAVANTPFTPYPGEQVAPLSNQTQAGLSNMDKYAYAAQPYLDQAGNMVQQGAGMQNQAGQYQQQGAAMQGQAGTMQNQGYSTVGQGAGMIPQAGNMTLGASAPVTMDQYSGQALSQFMNPYTSSVIDATQKEFNNQNAQQAQFLNSQNIGAGAFGGDRAGISQSILANQQNLAQAPVIAGLNQANFNQATQEFNNQQQTGLGTQEFNRQQLGQMGNQYGNLGTALSGMGAQMGNLGQQYGNTGNNLVNAGTAYGTTGNNVMNAGTAYGNVGVGKQTQGMLGATGQINEGMVPQGEQQAIDTAGQNTWNEGQAYPFQTTSFLNNTIQGLGNSSGGTGTTSTPGPSGLSQAIGAGTAIAGAAANFLPFSDIRLKENVTPVGKTFDGQTIHRFNYKGDPRTQIGLVAQEVEKRHPEAVYNNRGLGGLKQLDYNAATRDSERGGFAGGGGLGDVSPGSLYDIGLTKPPSPQGALAMFGVPGADAGTGSIGKSDLTQTPGGTIFGHAPSQVSIPGDGSDFSQAGPYRHASTPFAAAQPTPMFRPTPGQARGGRTSFAEGGGLGYGNVQLTGLPNTPFIDYGPVQAIAQGTGVPYALSGVSNIEFSTASKQGGHDNPPNVLVNTTDLSPSLPNLAGAAPGTVFKDIDYQDPLHNFQTAGAERSLGPHYFTTGANGENVYGGEGTAPTGTTGAINQGPLLARPGGDLPTDTPKTENPPPAAPAAPAAPGPAAPAVVVPPTIANNGQGDIIREPTTNQGRIWGGPGGRWTGGRIGRQGGGGLGGLLGDPAFVPIHYDVGGGGGRGQNAPIYTAANFDRTPAPSPPPEAEPVAVAPRRHAAPRHHAPTPLPPPRPADTPPFHQPDHPSSARYPGWPTPGPGGSGPSNSVDADPPVVRLGAKIPDRWRSAPGPWETQRPTLEPMPWERPPPTLDPGALIRRLPGLIGRGALRRIPLLDIATPTDRLGGPTGIELPRTLGRTPSGPRPQSPGSGPTIHAGPPQSHVTDLGTWGDESPAPSPRDFSGPPGQFDMPPDRWSGPSPADTDPDLMGWGDEGPQRREGGRVGRWLGGGNSGGVMGQQPLAGATGYTPQGTGVTGFDSQGAGMGAGSVAQSAGGGFGDLFGNNSKRASFADGGHLRDPLHDLLGRLGPAIPFDPDDEDFQEGMHDRPSIHDTGPVDVTSPSEMYSRQHEPWKYRPSYEEGQKQGPSIPGSWDTPSSPPLGAAYPGDALNLASRFNSAQRDAPLWQSTNMPRPGTEVPVNPALPVDLRNRMNLAPSDSLARGGRASFAEGGLSGLGMNPAATIQPIPYNILAGYMPLQSTPKGPPQPTNPVAQKDPSGDLGKGITDLSHNVKGAINAWQGGQGGGFDYLDPTGTGIDSLSSADFADIAGLGAGFGLGGIVRPGRWTGGSGANASASNGNGPSATGLGAAADAAAAAAGFGGVGASAGAPAGTSSHGTGSFGGGDSSGPSGGVSGVTGVGATSVSMGHGSPGTSNAGTGASTGSGGAGGGSSGSGGGQGGGSGGGSGAAGGDSGGPGASTGGGGGTASGGSGPGAYNSSVVSAINAAMMEGGHGGGGQGATANSNSDAQMDAIRAAMRQSTLNFGADPGVPSLGVPGAMGGNSAVTGAAPSSPVTVSGIGPPGYSSSQVATVNTLMALMAQHGIAATPANVTAFLANLGNTQGYGVVGGGGGPTGAEGVGVSSLFGNHGGPGDPGAAGSSAVGSSSGTTTVANPGGGGGTTAAPPGAVSSQDVTTAIQAGVARGMSPSAAAAAVQAALASRGMGYPALGFNPAAATSSQSGNPASGPSVPVGQGSMGLPAIGAGSLGANPLSHTQTVQQALNHADETFGPAQVEGQPRVLGNTPEAFTLPNATSPQYNNSGAGVVFQGGQHAARGGRTHFGLGGIARPGFLEGGPPDPPQPVEEAPEAEAPPTAVAAPPEALAPAPAGEGLSGVDPDFQRKITANESGGRNVVSPAGARGPGQIMPGTFKQYALPGENIDNPEDNTRVQGRILADYAKRWPGDRERQAVAYFSGPGNVAPAGSPNPWIKDAHDVNESTSKYVANLGLGHNGGVTALAGAGGPDQNQHETQMQAVLDDAARPPDKKLIPEGVGDALMAAGFAMMAGQSPNAMTNIGQGALAGMKYYQGQRQLDREWQKNEAQIQDWQSQAKNRDALTAATLQNLDLERYKYINDANQTAYVLGGMKGDPPKFLVPPSMSSSGRSPSPMTIAAPAKITPATAAPAVVTAPAKVTPAALPAPPAEVAAPGAPVVAGSQPIPVTPGALVGAPKVTGAPAEAPSATPAATPPETAASPEAPAPAGGPADISQDPDYQKGSDLIVRGEAMSTTAPNASKAMIEKGRQLQDQANKRYEIAKTTWEKTTQGGIDAQKPVLQSYLEDKKKFTMQYDQARSAINELGTIYTHMQSGRATDIKAELASWANEFGFHMPQAATGDAAMKAAITQALQLVSTMGLQKAPRTGLREALLTVGAPTRDPAAIRKILTDQLASLDYNHDLYSGVPGKNLNVDDDIQGFTSKHKYEEYLTKARKEIPIFKGITPQTLKAVTGEDFKETVLGRLPPGALWSPSQQKFFDPSGKAYDQMGNPD